MKKIIAVLLSLLMAALVLAACTSPAGNEDSTVPEAASGQQPVEATDVPFNAADYTISTAAESGDLADIIANGKLVVGITDYAPMDYKDASGNWTGFDAEFARAVGAVLAVDVEFIEIDWDNKFTELESGTIDCIWNGMTITEEVTLNTTVSDAYVKNEQVVVMNSDKIAEYADVDSLKDLTFAVEAGSAGAAAAEDNGLKVVEMGTQTNALMEVAAGTADACIIDSTMADAMTGEGTSYADLGKGLVLTSEEYGVGCRKGSDLAAKINECIGAFKASGYLDQLAEKYELTLA